MTDWGFVEDPEVIREENPPRWDREADVVVVGAGAAGLCAALEAAAAGAEVVVLDRFDAGGATAVSGGVVYAGGGTSIQRAAGVEDSVEAMFRYLRLEVGDVVSEETLLAFCAQSSANLEWLQGHGVRFEPTLCPLKTSYPLPAWGLYLSGNEAFAPYRDAAAPAPRGHIARGGAPKPGGNLYRPLRASLARTGTPVLRSARAVRLLVGPDGGVRGIECAVVGPAWARLLHRRLGTAASRLALYSPRAARPLRSRCESLERTHAVRVRIRARRGVVLAAGGFAFNRPMLAEVAPAYRSGLAIGTVADDGAGILLGRSVGGAARRLDRVSAWRFLNPPEAFARGALVDLSGRRFANEMWYGATTGRRMVEEHGGRGFLVIDERLRRLAREQCRRGRAMWFQRAPALLSLWTNCRTAESLEDVARAAGIDPVGLTETVDTYNRAARGEMADPFGKDPEHMSPLEVPPFHVLDCSIGNRRWPCPVLTLGGLAVDEGSGAVLREDGEIIDGLYAAGRTALGVCSENYVSGLSLADCVFSGRRAGMAAARSLRTRQAPLLSAATPASARTGGGPAG